MFQQYQMFCEKKQFQVGLLWLYKTNHKWVLNFPTKRDWKQPSKIEYIEIGLEKFVSSYADKGITSIAFPMLGCGNGGLNWEEEVRPLMEQYLKNLPIDIYIHLYQKDPFETEQRNIQEIKKWLKSEPESLPFSELWEDISLVLSQENSYFTLDKKIGFTAKIIEKPIEGLEIKCDGQLFHVYTEQLIDLWQHIRSLGFLMMSSMSYEMESYAPYLISILDQLSYLKPVLISSNYQEMSRNPIGLQYIPNMPGKNLFDQRVFHEVLIHE